MRRVVLILMLLGVLPTQAQDIHIERLATGLWNPRGVAVLPDGRLVVVQAGTGYQEERRREDMTGSISLFEDVNGDGDYDEGEITPILSQQPSYNSLSRFESGHDEVNGVGDIVLLNGDQLFYTKDDPLAESNGRGEYRSDTGVFGITLAGEALPQVLKRYGTVNALAYDPTRAVFYVADSGVNAIIMVNLAGEILREIPLPLLEREQQAVPAGIAFDPSTGDVLVALFSGGRWLEDYSAKIAFFQGGSQILRLDPDSDFMETVITGLTTAVDVAVDEQGNIFVAEMTIYSPTSKLETDFDLFNPQAQPLAGGYERFSGRVSLYPATGDEPMVLVEGLDAPTNLTYHAGALYVSVGQGTPNRPILDGEGGLTQITGEIYRITGF